MKIAVFNKKLPQPDAASGCRRLVAILALLSEEHIIHFYHFGQDQNPSQEAALESMGIKVYSCLNNKPEAQLLKNHYDLGIFEFFHTAKWYLKSYQRLQPWSTTMVDSVDVHFARFKMAGELGIEQEANIERGKADEIRAYLQADIVGVITQEDEQLLKQEGINHTIVLPNIVPNSHRDFKRTRQPIALFVGGFAHDPNVDAVNWLMQDIWPKVSKNIPSCRLIIVGSGMPLELQQVADNAQNVTYLGYVDDLDPIIDKAAVSVAPLRYGAGMKGKVNQAMACGLPVVSTTVGLQGIHGKDGTHFHKCDTAEIFADRIIGLFESSSKQVELGRNGQSISDEICGMSLAQARLNQLISKTITLNNSRKLTLLDKLAIPSTYILQVLKRFVKPIIGKR